MREATSRISLSHSKPKALSSGHSGHVAHSEASAERLAAVLDTPLEVWVGVAPAQGTFRKSGVPSFGVLIIRILLFRVPY